MVQFFKSAIAVALVALSQHAVSHSWIEEIRLIDSNGQFTGAPGYPRAFVSRSKPNFNDRQLVHILPPGGDSMLNKRDVETDGIKPTDKMCRISQREPKQGDGPRLVASPGSMLAVRYLENGHVTLPQNSVRKPEKSGFVYIYGTTQPRNDENFLDVYKQWDETGKGGDGRGRLLAKQPYDDGRCYEVNAGSISMQRQKQYPHKADPLMGMNLWCQNNLRLPSDLPLNSPLTIYWVWVWPTLAGDTEPKQGKAEVYTTCMDIEIKAAPKSRSLEARTDASADLNNQAIPAYVEAMKKQDQPPAQPQAPATPSSPPAAQKAQDKPPVSSQPAATSPPVSSATSAAPSNPIGQAQSVVLAALGDKLVSELAQKLTANLAAATPQNPPSGAPSTQAAQSPTHSAGQNGSAAPSPSSTTTITQSTTSTIGAMAVASAVPSSMDLAQPMLAPSAATSAAPAPKAYKRCMGSCRRSRIFS